MTIVFAACAAVILIRAVWLHRRVIHHELLGLCRSGAMSCELRRCTHLVAHRDSSGAKTFPLPQETRTLVWRCAGLPWRTQEQSVGLPNALADSIAAVDAQQFDALFSVAFRRCGPAAPPQRRAPARPTRS
jgi:hypothetical protein